MASVKPSQLVHSVHAYLVAASYPKAAKALKKEALKSSLASSGRRLSFRKSNARKGGYSPNGVSDYKVVSRPFSDYL